MAATVVGCVGSSADGADVAPEAIVIQPGDDAAAVVAAAPAGATFRFTAGLHRGVSVTARAGDTYSGEPGAVLSGAVELGGFRPADGRWEAPGPAGGPPIGQCQPQHPACGLPEELFVDGRPLTRVANLADVRGAAWAVDAARRQVVVGSDPTGHLVELSTTAVAIGGSADDVTVEGLRFEHYANPANVGVVNMDDGAERWRIAGCEVVDSHGVGVVVRAGASVRGCWLQGNGQQGLGGTGADLLVEGNTIVGNNRAGFDPGWSAGGAKFAVTSGLRVRRNVVLHNDGPGLWTDVDCVDTLYEGNWVEDNTAAGIQHEISWKATIADNHVSGNGTSSPGWVWGAGIQIVNSADVTVTGNTVEGNRHAIVGIDQVRGGGRLGEWRLSRLVVLGNVVRDSGQTGIAQDHDDPAVSTRGHRFDGNTYQGRVSWSWLGAERSWTDWRSFGHDPNGSFLPPAG